MDNLLQYPEDEANCSFALLSMTTLPWLTSALQVLGRNGDRYRIMVCWCTVYLV